MSYRVDTLPWPLRPFYFAIAAILGFLIYLYYLLCRWTSQVSIEGPGDHDLSQHAIFCIWHESWVPYFVAFSAYRRPHALMTHPAAYMKPGHAFLRLIRLERFLLGSSGDEGKRAVNELAMLVKKGWSTTIAPDGPAGPARVLKRGVLHLALNSGTPIVPLTISAERFITWPSWDSKKFPLPFSRIQVTVHETIRVSHQNFDEAGRQIVAVLGGEVSPNDIHGQRNHVTNCAAVKMSVIGARVCGRSPV
jgi:lysophospholipid acyltransferase (LPLAT)-like uncharacterized protein